MSRTVVTMEGFRELEVALAQLPAATQKGVLTRTLKKAGQPIAEEAKRLAPVGPGRWRRFGKKGTASENYGWIPGGSLRRSIIVSPKLKNSVGKAEYSAVLRAGGSKAMAVDALRSARRAAGPGYSAEMFIGPSTPMGFHGHFLEFGTSHSSPKPFLRPAWDMKRAEALSIIKTEMANEILKVAKRVGRSKKFSSSVKYRASIGAMIAAGA